MFFATIFGWSNLKSRSSSINHVPMCYFPNQDIAWGNYACDLSLEVSFCCSVDYICLDNKICGGGDGGRARGTCTDQSWDSPDCPQYCTGGVASAEDVALISCQNVTNNALDYCCGNTNNCCETGVGRFRLDPIKTIGSLAYTALLDISSSTTSSSISISSTSSSSTSSSSSSSGADVTGQNNQPTMSSTSTAVSNSELSKGGKVGVGVVVPMTVIVIAVLSISLWKKSRKRSINKSQSSESQYEKPELNGIDNSLFQTHPQELQETEQRPAEMAGSNISELPVDERWVELPSRT